MFDCFWSPNIMKKGDYMTRICVAVDTNKVVMSADSMFINTCDVKKTFNNKKIAYGNNMIIGILGCSEFFVFHQKEPIQIQKIIQNILQNTSFEDNRDTITYILNKLRPIYEVISDNQFTQLLCIWKEDKQFYRVAIQLSNKLLYYPLGNMKDKSQLLFKDSILEVGEGIDDIKIVPINIGVSQIDPSLISYQKVYEAIQDSHLESVGGNVYSVSLDIEGVINTYLDNIKHE